MPQRIKITDQITYWKATQNPLSADIGVVEGNQYTWIFDVGSSETSVKCIDSIVGQKNVILSHFHQDHIGNISKIDFKTLYQGAHTKRYTKAGEVVCKHLEIEDGVKIHLFELPCSHAKGSVGLEVNEKYAFLGDATYPTMKDGKPAYNANLLAEEIKVLQALKAEYVLLSHSEEFVHRKEDVIAKLETIYALRDAQSAYILAV